MAAHPPEQLGALAREHGPNDQLNVASQFLVLRGFAGAVWRGAGAVRMSLHFIYLFEN